MKVNYAYNMFYQILTIILPMITAPYIARRLGANYGGIYSKTHAAANYFYLFTLLGVSNYGNRAIAKIRDSREDTSRTFWEIYSIQLFMSFVVTAVYLCYCFQYVRENRTVYLLLTFYVASGFVEINWFCFGMERFKLTTIRNTIVRLAILAAVFLFVHDRSDLWKYTLIMSSSSILSGLAVWPFVLKQVDFIKPSWKNIKPHIRPDLILFWPVLAISLYNIMDKLILGRFSTNEEVAFYSYAERIVIIPYTLILALDNVVMPRMSNIFAKNDRETAHQLMTYVMMFAMFMSAAMAFGLAGISDVFAPWFYGSEFERCGFYILLLAPTILFKSWAGALRTQYIIPSGRDSIYVISLTAGACVNLVLDFALIPSMDGVGAIIGTLAAELTVALFQFGMCRREIQLGEYVKDGVGFCLIGGIMFLVVRGLSGVSSITVVTLAVQIAAGVLLYIVLSCVYLVRIRKKPVFVNEILKMLRIRYRFH